MRTETFLYLKRQVNIFRLKVYTFKGATNMFYVGWGWGDYFGPGKKITLHT